MVDFVCWGDGSAPDSSVGTEFDNAVTNGNWDATTEYVDVSGKTSDSWFLERQNPSSPPLQDTNTKNDWSAIPEFSEMMKASAPFVFPFLVVLAGLLSRRRWTGRIKTYLKGNTYHTSTTRRRVSRRKG